MWILVDRVDAYASVVLSIVFLLRFLLVNKCVRVSSMVLVIDSSFGYFVGETWSGGLGRVKSLRFWSAWVAYGVALSTWILYMTTKCISYRQGTWFYSLWVSDVMLLFVHHQVVYFSLKMVLA